MGRAITGIAAFGLTTRTRTTRSPRVSCWGYGLG